MTSDDVARDSGQAMTWHRLQTGAGRILLKVCRLIGCGKVREAKMQVPFVTTVSFADRDGTAIHLQYGVSAGNEREARSELERRLINQELFNYSILEIRRATSTEAASLDLPAGSIKLLN
jgi:hypothetical protein